MILLLLILLASCSPQETEKETAAHAGGVASLCFSPDGKQIATAGADGKVRIWDPGTLKTLATLEADADAAHSVAYSPNGVWMASAGSAAEVKLWDAKAGTLSKRFSATPPVPVRALAFSPDGKTLAAADAKGSRVVLWAVESGMELPPISPKGAESVRCLKFSPDGKVLAIGDGKVLWIWDLAAGKERHRIEEFDFHGEKIAPAPGAVAISADGKRLAAPGNGRKALLWDLETGAPSGTRAFTAEEIQALCFSRDGARLYAGDARGIVKRWALDGSPIPPAGIHVHAKAVRCMEMDPAGSRLATCSDDGTLWVYPILK